LRDKTLTRRMSNWFPGMAAGLSAPRRFCLCRPIVEQLGESGVLGLLKEEFTMKIAALLVVAGLAAAANAGVYAGPGGAIPDFSFTAGPGVFVSTIDASVDTDFPITSVVVVLRFGTGTVAGNREHTWASDLIATVSFGATNVRLFNRQGGNGHMNGPYTFAAGGAAFPPAAVGGNLPNGTYAPFDPLSAFNGGASNGIWTLRITDNAGGDVGDIVNWELRIIPAPGALALLGLGGLVAGRRNRR